MNNLSRNEIIELRARAMYKAFNPDSNIDEILIFLGNSSIDKYREMAEATIEADEKAGVLMLVEGCEPEIGDMGRCTDGDLATYCGSGWKREYVTIRRTGGNDVTIIQRANTPVYQCKKEM